MFLLKLYNGCFNIIFQLPVITTVDKDSSQILKRLDFGSCSICDDLV